MSQKMNTLFRDKQLKELHKIQLLTELANEHMKEVKETIAKYNEAMKEMGYEDLLIKRTTKK